MNCKNAKFAPGRPSAMLRSLVLQNPPVLPRLSQWNAGKRRCCHGGGEGSPATPTYPLYAFAHRPAVSYNNLDEQAMRPTAGRRQKEQASPGFDDAQATVGGPAHRRRPSRAYCSSSDRNSVML